MLTLLRLLHIAYMCTLGWLNIENLITPLLLPWSSVTASCCGRLAPYQGIFWL